jgi:predicted DNA-binding helix-hairpin-helix protein
VRSAQRIVIARRTGSVDFIGLKRLGVVLKRAQYFITCRGKRPENLDIAQDALLCSLLSKEALREAEQASGMSYQLSLLEHPALAREELYKCLSGQL